MLKNVHLSLVGLAALILAAIIAAIVVVPQTTVGVIKVDILLVEPYYLVYL